MQHSGRTAGGRWAERYRPQSGAGSFVELRLADGSCWRLDLLNISAGGVSFGLDRGLPCLASGTTVDDALVHVGDVQIAGRLVLVHVTEDFSAGTVCGAAFTPTTETDRLALSTLIERFAGPAPRNG